VREAFVIIVANEPEPAFENSARHTVTGWQAAAKVIAVNRLVVAIENEVAAQRDVNGVVYVFVRLQHLERCRAPVRQQRRAILEHHEVKVFALLSVLHCERTLVDSAGRPIVMDVLVSQRPVETNAQVVKIALPDEAAVGLARPADVREFVARLCE
jgi:hypothetical protein